MSAYCTMNDLYSESLLFKSVSDKEYYELKYGRKLQANPSTLAYSYTQPQVEKPRTTKYSYTQPQVEKPIEKKVTQQVDRPSFTPYSYTQPQVEKPIEKKVNQQVEKPIEKKVGQQVEIDVTTEEEYLRLKYGIPVDSAFLYPTKKISPQPSEETSSKLIIKPVSEEDYYNLKYGRPVNSSSLTYKKEEELNVIVSLVDSLVTSDVEEEEESKKLEEEFSVSICESTSSSLCGEDFCNAPSVIKSKIMNTGDHPEDIDFDYVFMSEEDLDEVFRSNQMFMSDLKL